MLPLVNPVLRSRTLKLSIAFAIMQVLNCPRALSWSSVKSGALDMQLLGRVKGRPPRISVLGFRTAGGTDGVPRAVSANELSAENRHQRQLGNERRFRLPRFRSQKSYFTLNPLAVMRLLRGTYEEKGRKEGGGRL